MKIDNIYTEQDFLILYAIVCCKNGIKLIKKEALERKMYDAINNPRYKDLFVSFIFGLNINEGKKKVELFNAFNYAKVYEYIKKTNDENTYAINVNENVVNSIISEYSDKIISLINDLQQPHGKLKYIDPFLASEIPAINQLKKQ